MPYTLSYLASRRYAIKEYYLNVILTAVSRKDHTGRLNTAKGSGLKVRNEDDRLADKLFGGVVLRNSRCNRSVLATAVIEGQL